VSAVETPPITQDEGLFDGKQFEVPYPERDGATVGKIVERFAGSFELNRNDEEDTQHAESARYGQMRRFTVIASLAGRATSGSDDQVTETLVWKIHSVER
jgi:hypothetical protein